MRADRIAGVLVALWVALGAGYALAQQSPDPAQAPQDPPSPSQEDAQAKPPQVTPSPVEQPRIKAEEVKAAQEARPEAMPQPRELVIPKELGSQAGLGDVTRVQLGQEEPEFRFLAYFLTRAEMSNVAPSNDLLKGQTVGRLFGPNTTRSYKNRRARFLEQRLIPFMIFKPRILDGLAQLRMSFELDWTWGDQAYSTGGNFGGGFAADQVNLQTQNVEVELQLPWQHWRANIGLQRLFDNQRDPYRTFFETLSGTGQKLAFFGADATGVTVQGPALGQDWRAGIFQLYENNISKDDDVWLAELSTRRYLGRDWNLGLSARFLSDTADATGGVSILGQGPTSNLAEYNGVYRFELGGADYEMDVYWLGVNADHNPEFGSRGFGGSGFVVSNLGKVKVKATEELEERELDISGLAANLMVGYRWGASANDRVSLHLLYTTGDDNDLEDDTYSGVLTGNTWTSPGAVYNSHGAYLLFPHTFVVNRYYGAVSDISNAGNGVQAAFLNVSQDVIRNKLTLKLGGAAALSNVTPEGGGDTIGYEGNLRATWQVGTLLSLDVHAAYLVVGDYYKSEETVSEALFTSENFKGRPENAWTTFTTLRWLMF